ncbi:MAG: glycosyltransferase family 9 protein [Cyclobacteriaceae bacterium]|nr:glycosyltransferase family 9 protein [Cyclobacteriaceae bacterium HetDA_MAG_MS6]
MKFNRILIIQTAFIGDVVLATSVIEKLSAYYPDADIDFLLRKGNEPLLAEHPKLREVIVWNKQKAKYRSLFQLIGVVRKRHYDLVINLQRFATMGLLTTLSRGKVKVGFDKNPFSVFWQKRVTHQIGDGLHEVERNLNLVRAFTDDFVVKPKLYLSENVLSTVKSWTVDDFITIAPSSVWSTKQFPKEKWIEFIQKSDFAGRIYLLGAKSDRILADEIVIGCPGYQVVNLCGKLSMLQSVALMKSSLMNYVNDSAPMHFASAVNAPTTAVFCATVPEFGFGPLSDHSHVVQVRDKLNCRPCGLHGKRKCPHVHFRCAQDISVDELLSTLPG